MVIIGDRYSILIKQQQSRWTLKPNLVRHSIFLSYSILGSIFDISPILVYNVVHCNRVLTIYLVEDPDYIVTRLKNKVNFIK